MDASVLQYSESFIGREMFTQSKTMLQITEGVEKSCHLRFYCKVLLKGPTGRKEMQADVVSRLTQVSISATHLPKHQHKTHFLSQIILLAVFSNNTFVLTDVLSIRNRRRGRIQKVLSVFP